MNKKLIIISAISTLLLPVVVLAYISPGLPTAVGTFDLLITKIINIVWPILAAATVLSFFVSAFFFVTSNGEPDKVSTARQALIYGIIGIVVSLTALSVPAIIKLLGGF